MEAFEKHTLNKYEKVNDQAAIEQLIHEFPDELQDRLWLDVEEYDDRTARDFLVSKIIERKIALLPSEYREIPEAMEIINSNPEALQESLDRAHESGSEFFLGSGHNAEVVSSTRQEGICYKTLFMERAKDLGVNIAREALLQNSVHELFKGTPYESRIPSVEGFVKTKDIQAIKMEKIEGFSLRQYFDNPDSLVLPENFDAEYFFNTLSDLVCQMNIAGYFHRDLLGNAGNVICDSEGLPVLIDFGAAVKAVDYDPENTGYQIVPGGQHYIGNDVSAIEALKKKFIQFQIEREEL
ncbi:MAG: serine/threonine protein kinase [Candidatus Paceibacteria bacterium]|jgi:serine/threonine protein kinase